jgi:hypothetical protein
LRGQAERMTQGSRQGDNGPCSPWGCSRVSSFAHLRQRQRPPGEPHGVLECCQPSQVPLFMVATKVPTPSLIVAVLNTKILRVVVPWFPLQHWNWAGRDVVVGFTAALRPIASLRSVFLRSRPVARVATGSVVVESLVRPHGDVVVGGESHWNVTENKLSFDYVAWIHSPACVL